MEVIKRIAQNRFQAIKENSSLSTAPAANSELMKFMSDNRNLKVMDVMNEYSKELKRLQIELFKSIKIKM